jgi:hypothetical protein
MIHIRLYREGADMWNQPIIKKGEKEDKKREKEKEKTHVQ